MSVDTASRSRRHRLEFGGLVWCCSVCGYPSFAYYTTYFRHCGLCGGFAPPIPVFADYRADEEGVDVAHLRMVAKERVARAKHVVNGLSRVHLTDLLRIVVQRETLPVPDNDHTELLVRGIAYYHYRHDERRFRRALAMAQHTAHVPGAERKTLYARVPPALHGWLKRHCEQLGVTVNDYMADLVRRERDRVEQLPEQRQ